MPWAWENKLFYFWKVVARAIKEFWHLIFPTYVCIFLIIIQIQFKRTDYSWKLKSCESFFAMYVEIAWTRQRILASYLHNYKLRKLVFSVSKNLFFTPLNKIRMPLFVSLDDIFFVQFFTNITAMLCARYPWNFLQRFENVI